MILRFFRFDDPAHRDAVELLPWLVNGTLASVERARVERHVAQCVACRRELEAARALQDAVASEERDPAVASALARLRVRLDEVEAGYGVRRLVRMLTHGWREARPVVRRTLAAQFALIVVLIGAVAIMAAQHPGPALYRTLADAPSAAESRSGIVVVFKGEYPERELRGALARLNARIVDGPSPVGAYRLEWSGHTMQEALALLRAEPSVAFAEPVPAQGAPQK